jgi:hypothetical protein
VSWEIVVGNVLVALSAGFAVAFVALYHLSSPWWRSEAGRHVMSFMGIIGAVLILTLIRIVAGAKVDAHWPWFTWLRVVVFAGVPGVIAWRLWMLWRLQYRGRTWAQVRGHRAGRGGDQPPTSW